jgi:hypothetical protein
MDENGWSEEQEFLLATRLRGVLSFRAFLNSDPSYPGRRQRSQSSRCLALGYLVFGPFGAKLPKTAFSFIVRRTFGQDGYSGPEVPRWA